MSIHKALESIESIIEADRIGAPLLGVPTWENKVSKNMVDFACFLLKRAVHFDFRVPVDGDKARNLTMFGWDLMDTDLFALPLEAVLYSLNNDMLYLVTSLYRRIEEGEINLLFCISIQPLKVKGKTIYFPTLYADLYKDGIKYKCHSEFIPSKSLMKFGLDKEEYTRVCVDAVLGMTTMLMSKSIEKEEIAAPGKLNKKRISLGKFPISAKTIIRIADKYKSGKSGGGSHASPIMHWRRGHFREYKSGLIVPVAPTLVNATDDALPAVKKYVIGH